MGYAFTWKLEAWFQVLRGEFVWLRFTLPGWFELPSVYLENENGSWKEAEAVVKGSAKGLGFLELELSEGPPIAQSQWNVVHVR